MKIVFCGYRDWARKIASALRSDGHELLLIEKKEDLTLERVNEFKPDLFFLVGWSWIVSKELFEKYLILCLHPSLLPKYRGGSPIQNQIINGEKNTGVSLFKVTAGLDEGDLYGQEKVSFEGHLSEVLDRISESGLRLYRKIIADYPNLKSFKQDSAKATVFKRRKPEESELTLGKVIGMSAEQVFDFVRALEDPYPNAFIKINGRRIVLKRVELE
ncbi:MAG: formyltransferase family protein [Candidatus Micrarchaeota archaeon]